MVLCSRYDGLIGLGGLGGLDGLGGFDRLAALAAFHALRKTGSWFTRSLFLVSYQRVRKAWLLAVLPSKSDAKTTQGQSCSSND